MKGRSVIVAFIVFLAVFVFAARELVTGGGRGPSLVERVQTGELAPERVESVEVLRFGGSRRLSEQEYGKLERSTISDKQSVERLFSILHGLTVRGTQPHNHPGTIHEGFLRVQVHGGEYFYLYFIVLLDRNGPFVVLEANSANRTNHLGVDVYESVDFVRYLQTEDPWFPPDASKRLDAEYPNR